MRGSSSSDESESSSELLLLLPVCDCRLVAGLFFGTIVERVFGFLLAFSEADRSASCSSARLLAGVER